MLIRFDWMPYFFPLGRVSKAQCGKLRKNIKSHWNGLERRVLTCVCFRIN